ncbi:permease [Vibrio penaeicida]|uniref:permease n=1 Tax=Vibrio penaeicida TaxID=104609 RepID=UPI000CEA1272|nr:permease [Vibrio penaeicida]
MMSFMPFIYLLVGFCVGKTRLNLKVIASQILTKLVIPLVIIWNISLHLEQMVWVIVLTFVITLILFFGQQRFGKDAVRSLCFCYLNIGWLGLPIAHTLFGEEAARFVLAVYIGSSIFGNSIGANFLSKTGRSYTTIFRSPPVVALVVGCLLIPFNHWVESYAGSIYQVSKFLMSFLGMMVLGIWLSETTLKRCDALTYTKTYLFRILILGVALLIVMVTYLQFDAHIMSEQMLWLFLICLLPPAANIIVLETSYLGTGTSAARISIETVASLFAIAVYGVVLHYLPN